MRVGRYRELTSLARIMWDRNYDPKLTRWLKRIGELTLILWGTKDRIIPIEQAKLWASLIPASEAKGRRIVLGTQGGGERRDSKKGKRGEGGGKRRKK